jgi:hypothetical protein
MARQKHGAVTFIIAIVAIYFVVRYWASIQAVAGSVVNAVSTSTVPTPASTLPVVNMSSGAPGDPAFSAAFGGSSAGFDGNLFAGPLGRANGSLGFFLSGGNGQLGAIEESNGSGPNAQPGGQIPTGFGRCSTQPTDGKMLCA